MAARLGLELTPLGCRIVDVEDTVRPGGPPETRVRAFGNYGRPSKALRAALDELGGRTAVLVAWGLAADHAQPVVPCGPYDRMRGEALARCEGRTGSRAQRRLADIAPAAPVTPGAASRPVVLVSAPAAAVAAVVQPFTAAGIRVRSVLTPAAALMSLARQRPCTDPGALVAYVALAETTIAIALVRDGALLSADEAPWGYLDPDRTFLPRQKNEVAAYLGAHLETVFEAARPTHGPVTAVYVCGGMPEMRTMTTALIECLDVEVEPLDSLFGIENNGADWQERAAELRLAWAAAVDWPAPLDLLRERRQQRQRAWVARAAVVAGMTTGLGLGVAVESAGWGAGAVSAAAALARADHQAPAAEQAAAPEVDGPTVPTIAVANFERSVEPPPDLVFAAERPVSGPWPTPSAPVAPVPAPRPTRSAPVASPPAPPPFSADLQTILYGPERQLAVIDGHILAQGDEIRGARVVQITPTAVVVRDRVGRDTQLHVGQTSR